MKHFLILSAFAMVCLPLAATADTSKAPVEIMLESKIDEDRGYCLDIAGGKGERAPVERGLQAHTCYNYTGEILVDQGFDPSEIEEGQFRIPYFDVCMTVESIEVGAPIALAACDQSDTQKFTLDANGQLVSQSKPELCVTVSSTEKKNGRGASPVHVMRPVSLQQCDADNKEYQTWKLNSL